MYSESDIDNAVAAGVVPAAVATAFRNYTAESRAAPAVDEEHFRLLTGFNDIFVSIALVLSLAAIGQIAYLVAPPLAGVVIAGAAWLLAEYFTRYRRMALPSILLLLAFVIGVVQAQVALVELINPNVADRVQAVIGAGIGVVTAAATWLHWRRFLVPITVAAGAVAVAAVAMALTLAAFPAARNAAYPITIIAGLGVFALAMRWDMSDKERRTRRSDVAFWLHLAAAPMIAHPLFQLIGVFDNDVGVVNAVIVVVLYLAFGFVALAIDRRALLVSSLAYVLYAMYALIQKAGAVELSAALTAFVIGSALLTLSVFWHPMRAKVVGMLGTLKERLPPVQPMVPA